MATKLKINAEFITRPGLIVKALSETKTRVRTEVIDVFFPVHQKRWGKFQIEAKDHKHWREFFVGQKREFWKSGSRFGFEVGGTFEVADWMHG